MEESRFTGGRGTAAKGTCGGVSGAGILVENSRSDMGTVVLWCSRSRKECGFRWCWRGFDEDATWN